MQKKEAMIELTRFQSLWPLIPYDTKAGCDIGGQWSTWLMPVADGRLGRWPVVDGG